MRLDNATLSAQRIQADTILTALLRGRGGWSNHPTVRMWSGYTDALVLYRNMAIREHVLRKGRNSLGLLEEKPADMIEMPWWVGSNHVMQAHRALLVEKNYEFYSKTWGGDPAWIPFCWPKGARFPNQFNEKHEDEL